MENGAGEGYQTYKWNVELDVLVLRFEKVWKEDMNLGGFFLFFGCLKPTWPGQPLWKKVLKWLVHYYDG